MPLADGAYDRAMRPLRSPAYWPTRIMLAIGFIATVFVFALALTLMLAEPPLLRLESTVLGVPNRVVGAAPGLTVAVFGLVWMIRIFRGPRDEPPRWRYRDR